MALPFIANKNYVCDLQKRLGQGSFGDVYEGYKIRNGEQVAIKLFKKSVPQKNLAQEFNIMKSVSHQNIVRLISIEEFPQHGSFIIMELCTGGSLLNVLQDPRNLYGLEEDEYIVLISNVKAGIKYLRDNKLIHRDIKPGNILKFIECNGDFVYKLTDFGAARKLEDNECFTSIYGTEEYLHPDIYGPAVLHMPKVKEFEATVDLWSIGATLYQAATGQTPFRTFAGRQDRVTMFKIISTKPSGIISGIQSKLDGPIEWNKELPIRCEFNEKFKNVVTALLIGLLETNPAFNWNFDKFFEEVDAITSLKRIVIFSVNQMRYFVNYLKPDDDSEHLQSLVAEQTGTDRQNQLLLHRTENFALNSKAKDYPTFTKEQPLILIDKKNRQEFLTTHKFLNVIHALKNNNIKELEANEFANERKIDDLLAITGQCKTVTEFVYSNFIREQEKHCLKLKYPIRLNYLIGQINDKESEEKRKRFEIAIVEANISTESTINALTKITQKIENSITDDVEKVARRIKVVCNRIRCRRNDVYKTGLNDLKQLFAIHINQMSSEMTQLYSNLIRNFTRLSDYMTNWCECVKMIEQQMAASREQIRKCDVIGQNLENLVGQLTASRGQKTPDRKFVKSEHRKSLNVTLRELQKVCKENSDMLESQTSLIENINTAIFDSKIEHLRLDEEYPSVYNKLNKM